MKVYIERDNKTLDIEISEPKTCKQVLKKLSIPLESVILMKNGTVCLEDEEVTNSDHLKILSVISGG